MNATLQRSAFAGTVLIMLVFIAGVANASAQTKLFDNPLVPTISPVPDSFVGTWDWNTPRQSCGSTVDSYGEKPILGQSTLVCQWPIDQLEKVLNGRGKAWQKF